MLPFLTPLAEDTLDYPLPKEKRFTASLAVETLEHPLPKESSFNASFLNSFSRGYTGASFTKGKEIHCFLSSGNTGASFTKGKELQCFLSFLL